MNAITKSLLVGLSLTLFAVGCASPSDDDAQTSADSLETTSATANQRSETFDKSSPDIVEGELRAKGCAPSISPDPWKHDRTPFVPAAPSKSKSQEKEALFDCK